MTRVCAYLRFAMHTVRMTKLAEDSANDTAKAQASDWQRLGADIRKARLHIGYSNREDFSEVCNISVRVLSDLESGVRTNFSERILARVEAGLGWPAGTIDQIVFDANFTAPTAAIGGDLLFRPPDFKRQPVLVEVGAVEKTLSVLTDIARQQSASKPSSEASSEALTRIAAAAVSLCWPYVIRLVEDNCLPGNELHPAVRPIYEAFLAVQSAFAPEDTSGRYAQWLAGDLSDVPETGRRRYMERWTESRRAKGHRRTAGDTED